MLGRVWREVTVRLAFDAVEVRGVRRWCSASERASGWDFLEVIIGVCIKSWEERWILFSSFFCSGFRSLRICTTLYFVSGFHITLTRSLLGSILKYFIDHQLPSPKLSIPTRLYSQDEDLRPLHPPHPLSHHLRPPNNLPHPSHPPQPPRPKMSLKPTPPQRQTPLIRLHLHLRPRPHLQEETRHRLPRNPLGQSHSLRHLHHLQPPTPRRRHPGQDLLSDLLLPLLPPSSRPILLLGSWRFHVYRICD